MLYVILQNMKNDSPYQIQYTGILIIWNVFAILLLSIGSATLFLNYLKKIRDNKFYRFLSFFLVPLLMIAVSVTSRLLDGQSLCEIAVLYPIFLSFIPCLSVAYILFSRKLQKNDN